jgi:hypothetical protein
MQMLVVYAWQQGLLDHVTFFGVVHNYKRNIMIGMGYTTVNVIARFDHTPSYLFDHLPKEFEVELEDILGPRVLARPGKSRHEREWVI